MTKYLTIIGLQIFLLGCFITSNAQKKDSTYVGTIEGVVKDSVHNYVLRSATLSIYKAGDDKLISYQLSNNFGKFQFKELPVGVKLNILMSYVGYQVYKKEFVIPADTRVLDLKMLIAERAENNLEEVKIVAQKAPVEMKGDTTGTPPSFHLSSPAPPITDYWFPPGSHLSQPVSTCIHLPHLLPTYY